MKMIKYIVPALVAMVPTAVLANSDVKLSSVVFVEKQVERKNGKTAIILEEPATVLPGDKLVFILKYKNHGTSPATDFVVTNPLPAAVAFQETSDGAELVSVDGGQNWGPLATLTVQPKNGKVRTATPADVTHLKWKLNKAITKGSEGQLIFRGVVR